MSKFNLQQRDRIEEVADSIIERQKNSAKILFRRQHPNYKDRMLEVGTNIKYSGQNFVSVTYYFDKELLPPGFREPLTGLSELPADYVPSQIVEDYLENAVGASSNYPDNDFEVDIESGGRSTGENEIKYRIDYVLR